MKNKKGFTITELLVVIFIISLILGIVIPRLNRSTEGTKLKTTVDSIVGVLETAKSFASAQHVLCGARYTGGEVYIERQDADDANNNGDTEEMIRYQRGFDISSGISVSFTPDNVVTFNPWGGVENADGSITVSSSSLKKSKTITVNTVTGYIKVT